MTDAEPTTKAGLIRVLEGWPLVHPKNLIRDELCKRCDDKNDVRRRYGMETEEIWFDPGERIRGIAIYDDEQGTWSITALHHTRHPQKDPEDIAVPDTHQAIVTLEVHPRGWTYYHPPLGDTGDEYYHVEDRYVAEDVRVEWFSPKGEGEEREPIREPDPDTGAVALEPTDPRPNWPEEENEWRKEIMQEHGDWNDEVPTVDLRDTDPV